MTKLKVFLDVAALKREILAYHGSAGVSEGCCEVSFSPAFRDQETGRVYLSRYPNGRVAAIHTQGVCQMKWSLRVPGGGSPDRTNFR